MEAGETWFSIAIGAALGAAYVAASFVAHKRALRSGKRFLLIVVATMFIRMFVALIFLAGILLLLPVTASVFLGSFFVMFIIGLIAEIWLINRRGAAVEGGSS